MGLNREGTKNFDTPNDLILWQIRLYIWISSVLINTSTIKNSEKIAFKSSIYCANYCIRDSVVG
jgi:hypothetical protein